MEYPQGEGPGYVHGYKLATLEDYQIFKDDCDSQEDTWKVQLDKENFKVWTRKSDVSYINIVRAWAFIEGIPANVMYDVFHDPTYRTTWDDKMIQGYNIEVLDHYNDIGYYSLKFPTPLQNRDFCNQRSWWISEDKSEYIIMNHSVPHEECPEQKGFTRALSIRSGYLIRRDPNNPEENSLLVYMAQADPKGLIPAFAINFATKKMAPQLIERLVNVSRAYPEWKSQEENNPDEKPWLTTEKFWWEREEENKKDGSESGEKKKKKKKKQKTSGESKSDDEKNKKTKTKKGKEESESRS